MLLLNCREAHFNFLYLSHEIKVRSPSPLLRTRDRTHLYIDSLYCPPELSDAPQTQSPTPYEFTSGTIMHHHEVTALSAL